MLKIKAVYDVPTVLALVEIVGATTMAFKVDGYKYAMGACFLSRVVLDEGVKISFYDKDSKLVAKWVV